MSPTLRSCKSCKKDFIFSDIVDHIPGCITELYFIFPCVVAVVFLFLPSLAEKELQRKSLEDSLNAERSSGASRETNMQVYSEEHFTTASLLTLYWFISLQECVAVLSGNVV